MLQLQGTGLVLTHGAGGNRDSALLLALEAAFQEAGVYVVRYNLPFRQRRPFGPPSPATAAADRQGLAEAVAEMRKRTTGPVFMGGHSYGGRQASMLAADQPGIVDALLLLSYPLHPPNKPDQLRTAHFPNLETPALFVHGTKDPFATIEELKQAAILIPVSTALHVMEGAGHDLKTKKGFEPTTAIVHAFADLS